jgi:maltose alpha-D-glucosyltransferase/alpha-amylase
MYGNIEDARRFIAEAHRRGLRVITELVINHTSDQHAWFQRARRRPKGSPSATSTSGATTPEKYQGVRIIFKDFEPSNWTFDHVAGQYYWHRFFHHQPDLNFDNPAVHDAVLKVCDFWMAAGVDGVRLDAVPVPVRAGGDELREPARRRTTSEEDAAARRHALARPDAAGRGQPVAGGRDRLLRAGRGRRVPHELPLPPDAALFMSLRMEDRYPIIDILEQTPPVPPTGSGPCSSATTTS